MPSTIEDGNSSPQISDNETQQASQISRKCLEYIETYRKGKKEPGDKAKVIREVTDALSASTPTLTNSEFNDALGTYFSIIDSHQNPPDEPVNSGASDEPSRPEALNVPTSKRALSPDPDSGAGKRQKLDENELPWVIREKVSGTKLGESLTRTLELLRLYARDLKLTKSSILTSAGAPQFPHSEWQNVITGAMVDLDHVISGSFAVSNDNREVEVVGGIQFKFGATTAVKKVKTAGDWFIAWGIYTKALVFVFPHRKSELDDYGAYVLKLFAATSLSDHVTIIQFDKAIRARHGDSRDLLLTDYAQYQDLSLYWLNPIGTGHQSLRTCSKPSKATRSDFRSDEACRRWNSGDCRQKASECKYRHVCGLCGGKHKRTDCAEPKGSA
jgi:hypothetical protein